jgi:hypothetical protein
VMSSRSLHRAGPSRSDSGRASLTAHRQVMAVKMGVANAPVAAARPSSVAGSLVAKESPSPAHVIRGVMGLLRSGHARALLRCHRPPKHPIGTNRSIQYLPSKLLALEPLPWDMSVARQLLVPYGRPMAFPPHPSPCNPFKMHNLLAALPDPMLLESTLTLPTATSHAHNQSLLPHSNGLNHNPPVLSPHLLLDPRVPLQGPDGEIWLPEEPFHVYGGPSAFGPDIDWGSERSAAFPHAED